MLEILLAASLAVADPAAVPDVVTIGETELNGWALKAETFVQHNKDSLPTIGGMRCEARRNGLTLRVYRDGGVSLEIKGSYPEGEEGDDFGYTNVEGLYLNGHRYEARWGERDLIWRFTDVAYPKPPPPRELPPGTLESVTPIQEAVSGFLAVRRPGEAQWHHIDALGDELTRGRRLLIFFRGSFWRHDRNDPLRSLTVPLDRLERALAWCRRTMASDRALLLHPDRAQGEGSKP
ncbi:MAG TPA: hypothetical protein VFZ91_02960 [Allosphingosinicella sp.]